MSCRYVEGVEVLYGTNTFNIHTRDLDQNPLVDCIPTPYLSLVKSLEWIVEPNTWLAPNYTGDKKMWKTVRGMPLTQLSNLQTLYIGFRDGAYSLNNPDAIDYSLLGDRYRFYTEHVLVPLGKLISAGIADGLREVEIGVPTATFHAYWMMGLSAWSAQAKTGSSQGLKFETPGWGPDKAPQPGAAWGPRQRMWQPVEQGRQGHGARGYWLSESVPDVPCGFGINMPRYWE